MKKNFLSNGASSHSCTFPIRRIRWYLPRVQAWGALMFWSTCLLSFLSVPQCLGLAGASGAIWAGLPVSRFRPSENFPTFYAPSCLSLVVLTRHSLKLQHWLLQGHPRALWSGPAPGGCSISFTMLFHSQDCVQLVWQNDGETRFWVKSNCLYRQGPCKNFCPESLTPVGSYVFGSCHFHSPFSLSHVIVLAQ